MFYGFLCATLPTLVCGVQPEITLEQFDALAAEAMTAGRLAQLKSWDDPECCCKVDVYRRMREFDNFLKLRIAAARQEKLGTSQILADPGEIFSEVDFSLPGAAAADDPLERERMIDLIRWRKIDDLECGHELDFTALCCYRLRLVSLEKLRARTEAAGETVFDEAVDKLSGVFSNI